jgi:hypothetical protein
MGGKIWVRFPARTGIFIFVISSRPVLRLTQSNYYTICEVQYCSRYVQKTNPIPPPSELRVRSSFGLLIDIKIKVMIIIVIIISQRISHPCVRNLVSCTSIRGMTLWTVLDISNTCVRKCNATGMSAALQFSGTETLLQHMRRSEQVKCFTSPLKWCWQHWKLWRL